MGQVRKSVKGEDVRTRRALPCLRPRRERLHEHQTEGQKLGGTRPGVLEREFNAEVVSDDRLETVDLGFGQAVGIGGLS